MFRQIALIALREGVGMEGAPALEAGIAAAAEQAPSLRRSHLGRHLPGTWGGGDYTWDALFDDAEACRRFRDSAFARAELAPLLDPGSLAGPVAHCDVVHIDSEEEPNRRELKEPGIGNLVKRTLLLNVAPDAPREVVERFERDTRGMPEHIHTIRNWALSRTTSALAPQPYSHVWEQEYRELEGLLGEYMESPYHWGYVDAWFDLERPECIVAPDLAHVFCPAADSILGWCGNQSEDRRG